LLETNTVFSESEKDHLNCVAKNIIVSSLDSNEFLMLEHMALNERGGELFKKDFRKLLSLE